MLALRALTPSPSMILFDCYSAKMDGPLSPVHAEYAAAANCQDG